MFLVADLLIKLAAAGIIYTGISHIQPVNDPALNKSCITATSEAACLHEQPIERWVK